MTELADTDMKTILKLVQISKSYKETRKIEKNKTETQIQIPEITLQYMKCKICWMGLQAG